MTETPHPPHKPPPTPAQEFAGIVGNMLTDKLDPIKAALQHLTDRFAVIEEEFKELRVRQDRVEGHQRVPFWLACAALGLSLIDLGAVLVLAAAK